MVVISRPPLLAADARDMISAREVMDGTPHTPGKDEGRMEDDLTSHESCFGCKMPEI